MATVLENMALEPTPEVVAEGHMGLKMVEAGCPFEDAVETAVVEAWMTVNIVVQQVQEHSDLVVPLLLEAGCTVTDLWLL